MNRHFSDEKDDTLASVNGTNRSNNYEISHFSVEYSLLFYIHMESVSFIYIRREKILFKPYCLHFWRKTLKHKVFRNNKYLNK